MTSKIQFTQVKNDANGNPRFVCHYTNLIKISEIGEIEGNYQTALKRAKKLHGRKFHNKQYGGGIVFQTYNIEVLEEKIISLINSLQTF